MRYGIFALVLAFCVACEKKLTPEELEEKRAAELAARGTPTPKPGDWMWKNHKNPLDKPK